MTRILIGVLADEGSVRAFIAQERQRQRRGEELVAGEGDEIGEAAGVDGVVDGREIAHFEMRRKVHIGSVGGMGWA